MYTSVYAQRFSWLSAFFPVIYFSIPHHFPLARMAKQTKEGTETFFSIAQPQSHFTQFSMTVYVHIYIKVHNTYSVLNLIVD
jgi:hypothetical protein